MADKKKTLLSATKRQVKEGRTEQEGARETELKQQINKEREREEKESIKHRLGFLNRPYTESLISIAVW